jgi:hypothetical protein
MPSLVSFAFAIALSANTAGGEGDGNAYRTWLAAQVHSAQHSDTDAAPVLAVVWQWQQCAHDPACEDRVANSAASTRAHEHASGNPALLALLAGAENPASDASRRIERWRELADQDARNSYPLMVLAGIQWQRNEPVLALEVLKRAIAKVGFDDYFSAMFAPVKRSLDAHPPSLAELAPCALAGEDAPAELDATQRSLAAAGDLLGGISFPQVVGVLAMCKTTAAPADRERRALCDELGAKIDARASTLLSQNIGLALRRSSTSDTQLQARYTRRQSDNLDDLQQSLWWFESARSPVRREATLLWLKEFVHAGELASAAALRKKYGDPPESREERTARWQKLLAERQACYARSSRASHTTSQSGTTADR